MARKKKRDDYDNIEIYVEEIGPAEATAYLKSNKLNRPTKPKKMLSYARDMKEGRWGICNDAICVDPDGRLLNGQNRLLAIQESRATVCMVVMHGVPTESFGHMDSGAPRTIKDALVLDGCEKRYALAASQILRGSWLYEAGKFYTIASGGGAIVISPEELLKLWRKDGAAVTEAAAWSVDSHQPVVKMYTMRVLRYMTMKARPKLGKVFTDMVRDGGGDAKHPAMKLKVALEKHKSAHMDPQRRGRLSRAQQMAYTIIAWNAFVEKTTIHTLKWTKLSAREVKKGLTAESIFPELIL